MSKTVYVYLTSVEHSGSTLVSCLLGAHPQISTVGEFGSELAAGGLCSCGQNYADCGFWLEWQARVERRGMHYEIRRPGVNLAPRSNSKFVESLYFYQFPYRWIDHLRDHVMNTAYPQYRRAVHTALDRTYTLVTELLAMEKSNIFLDTTKNPLQVRFLARDDRFQLKLISLVRDGRAVMNSLLTKEKYTPNHAIDAWLWGVRNAERAASNLSAGDVFKLRLEDLCADPSTTLHRIFEFCGVDSSVSLDYTDISRRHIVGNKARLGFHGSVRSDDAVWRAALSEDNLRLFEERAGTENIAFGYEPTR